MICKALTRDESRNPRLKAEGRFCLRKSWKADEKYLGPSESPLRSAYLARLFLPSVFSLQSSVYSSTKMTAWISCFLWQKFRC